ncbi:hypothetical protein HK405_015224, partial [Cladochytrium tenue]
EKKLRSRPPQETPTSTSKKRRESSPPPAKASKGGAHHAEPVKDTSSAPSRKKAKVSNNVVKEKELGPDILNRPSWEDDVEKVVVIDNGFGAKGTAADAAPDAAAYRVVLRWKEGVLPRDAVDSEHTLGTIRKKCKDK